MVACPSLGHAIGDCPSTDGRVARRVVRHPALEVECKEGDRVTPYDGGALHTRAWDPSGSLTERPHKPVGCERGPHTRVGGSPCVSRERHAKTRPAGDDSVNTTCTHTRVPIRPPVAPELRLNNLYDSLDKVPDDWSPPSQSSDTPGMVVPAQFRGGSGRQLDRTLRELHEFERRRRLAGGVPLVPPEFMAAFDTSSEFKASIYDYLEYGGGIDISVPCPKIPVTPLWAREAFWDRISLSRLRFKGDKRSYVRIRKRGSNPETPHDTAERPMLTLHVPPNGRYDDMHAALQASYRDQGTHFRGASGQGGLRVNCARLLELGAPPEEVARVQRGYAVALHSEPTRFHGRNYGGALDFPEKITAETERMVQAGFVEGPLLYAPHIVQSLGGVWKADKQKWRTIVNGTGSGVNPCSLNLGTTYDGLSDVLAPLSPGARMSSFDLTDAFLNWPYTEEHSELWGFQDPGSKDYYRYRYMAFGGRQSPSVQQRWANILKGIVNRHGLMYCPTGTRAASYDGFRCTGAYVDDFFLMHPPELSKTEADAQYASVLRVLDDLGFVYKASKSIWPTTTAAYVGFVIDTVSQTVSISETRATTLATEISEFISHATDQASAGRVSRRDLAALIGKLQWVVQIIPHGQRFLQQSYFARDAFVSAFTRELPVRAQWNPAVMVHLHDTAIEELRSWVPRLETLVHAPIFLTNLATPNGFWRGAISEDDDVIDAHFGHSEENVEVITGDASGDAGGGWYGHHRLVHFYPPDECAPVRSSNFRELKIVWHMLREWGERLRGKRVLVRSDNTTTVSVVNRGVSSSPDLQELGDAIYHLAQSLGIQLAARHIPGLKNGLADRLSRNLDVYRTRDLGDWQLRSDEFRYLEALSSREFDIDGAADPMGRNAQCSRYCSVSDSLLDTDIRGMHLWCNPDWHLASDSLRHFSLARSEQPETTSAVFLLPAWPTAPWWRQLRDAQLLAYYPVGSELFTAPDHRVPSTSNPLDRPRACFGGTKWGTVAVAFGCSDHVAGAPHTSSAWRGGRGGAHHGVGEDAADELEMRRTFLSGDSSGDAELLRRVHPRAVCSMRRTAI